MSSETIRLLFVAGLALLAGGAAGAYATRLVYGDAAPVVHPIAAREKVCPPCECPACPPPPECDGAQTATGTAPRAVLAPDEEPEVKKPGLPASAMRLARERTLEELASCMELARQTRSEGTLLLELTITATGGTGFISEASVGEKSDNARIDDAVEGCLRENARRVHFEWDADDGESRLLLPLRFAR